MIELDSLKFTVDTSQLKSAITEVGNLQKAVSDLNKPLAENARISAKAAKEAAAIAAAESKAAVASLRVEEAQNKVTAAKARADKAAERTIRTTTQEVSAVEKLNLQLEYMAKGFTTGQSSRLATMQSQGAAIEDITKAMDIFNQMTKLKGGDPFDKSLSGTKSLKNALRELRVENDLVGKGVELTSKQYKELAREKARIIQASLIEGKSFSEIKSRLEEQENIFVRLARRVNEYTSIEKERERSQRLQANALRSIATEDEKILSMTNSLVKAQGEHLSISDRAARSIANYERNLRLAGVSGEEAAKKLEVYRKGILAVHAAEEKRKVDMLSRALAPQISDVVVSLGSGMNPMTVLLQQGLQVRDLIGLSGVAVKDLQVAFKSAASDMVSSLKGTAVALSSLLIGGLKDAGAAVIKFGGDISGTNLILGKMQQGITNFSNASPLLQKAFSLIAGSAKMIAGLGVVAAIASIVSVLVALKQVISEEDKFAKALTLTNGQLGLSHDAALAYARSMNSVGVTTSDAMTVIAEMGKTGVLTASQIPMVTKAAVEMQKYGGVAIEDTVKAFAKMQDEPVKAILELVKTTGMVQPATVVAIDAMMKQGNQAGATALAMTTLADVNAYQVERMKNDYTGFANFMISLADEVKRFFSDIFKDLWVKASPEQALRKELAKVEEELSVFNPMHIGNLLGMDGYTKESLEKRRSDILKLINSQALLNEKKREQANSDREANNALSRTISLEDTLASKAKKRDLELKKTAADYDVLISRGLRKEADKEEALAAIRKKYEEKTKKGPKDKSASNFKARTLDIFRQDMEDSKAAMNEYMDMINSFQDSMADSEKNRFNARKEYDLGVENSFKALAEETDQLNLQYALIGKSAEEQKKILKYRELALEMEKELNEAAILFQFDPEYAAQAKNDIAEKYKIKLANFERGVDIETISQYQSKFSDAIMTALTSGKKAGAQKLRAIIEDELRKPLDIFINAIVSDLIGPDKKEGAAGTTDAFSSLTKTLDKLNSFGDRVGSTIEGYASKIGNFLSNSTNETMQSVGSMLKSSASSIGKVAGVIGNAVAGVQLFQAISNGYSISKATDAIGMVASAYFGPIGGIIAGAVNRLFGKKLADTGLEATFSSGGVSARNYSFYKGGVFSNDKTKYSAADSSLVNGLNEAFNAVKKNVIAMGKSIGVTNDQIKSFSKTLKVSFKGLSSADIQKKLQEVVGDVADGMAEYLLGTFETVQVGVKKVLTGWTTKQTRNADVKVAVTENQPVYGKVWKPSDFVKQGETALQALERLSSSLSAANIAFDSLGKTLFDISLVGADMASKLMDNFGSVNDFNSAISAYYDSFYSQEEKTATMVRQLTSALSALGLTLPNTKEEYRKLVDSQDLTTEKGRELFTALVKLSPIFSEISDATAEMQNAISAYYDSFYSQEEKTATMIRQLTGALSVLGLTLPNTKEEYRKLVDSQDLTTEKGRELFTALVKLSPIFSEISDATDEMKNAISDLTDSILEEVKRLRNEIVQQSTQGLASLKSDFLIKTAMAKAGDKNALSDLPALSQAIEEATKAQASSQLDIVRIQAWLANQLVGVADVVKVPTNTATQVSTIPAFADGGLHLGGARIVGENGPELEVTGPSRIFNNSDTIGLLSGNSDVIDVLTKLNDNIEGLRYEVRSDVIHNAKTANLLTRVIPEGDTIHVTVDGKINVGTVDSVTNVTNVGTLGSITNTVNVSGLIDGGSV